MSESNIKYQISNIRNRKIAIVTDWIYGGGSELVVEELHKMFPEAPIYTSYCSFAWRNKLDDKVVTGYLQRKIFVKLRKFLPLLRQWWFASLDLKEFDLVISVTGNGEAKFALSRLPQSSNINHQISNVKRPLHISYCNTPVHFYWRHYDKYLQHPGFRPAWLVRLGLKLLVKPLRTRDYKAAQKVDIFLANSTHIQNDIQTFYGRESTVVFPPVDTARFSNINHQVSNIPRSGFVTHGRLVPFKHTKLLVETCNQLKLQLTVIGKGPEAQELKALAGETVNIRGFVSDEDLPAEINKHSAYLFASFEDFGIAPVEAMACGLPVIAYKAGGALDYVEEGITGLFFENQTVVSLTETLKNFDAKLFDSSLIQSKAEQFSQASFVKAMQKVLESIN